MRSLVVVALAVVTCAATSAAPATTPGGAVAAARDGALLVAQIEPVPAVLRVDVARGTISTLALR